MQLEDIHENLCSLGEASTSGEAMSSSKSGYFGVEKLDDIWILAVEKKNSQKPICFKDSICNRSVLYFRNEV